MLISDYYAEFRRLVLGLHECSYRVHVFVVFEKKALESQLFFESLFGIVGNFVGEQRPNSVPP